MADFSNALTGQSQRESTAQLASVLPIAERPLWIPSRCPALSGRLMRPRFFQPHSHSFNIILNPMIVVVYSVLYRFRLWFALERIRSMPKFYRARNCMEGNIISSAV